MESCHYLSRAHITRKNTRRLFIVHRHIFPEKLSQAPRIRLKTLKVILSGVQVRPCSQRESSFLSQIKPRCCRTNEQPSTVMRCNSMTKSPMISLASKDACSGLMQRSRADRHTKITDLPSKGSKQSSQIRRLRQISCVQLTPRSGKTRTNSRYRSRSRTKRPRLSHLGSLKKLGVIPSFSLANRGLGLGMAA